MDHPPRDVVIERLEALERENRWMWRIGIVTVVAAIILIAEATNLIRPPKIIEAEGFVLKDASGRVRGQLKTNGNGLPEFTLLDEDGYDQVNLHGTYDNNASLEFFDHGQPRILLSASSDGSAILRMSDDGDENRMALFLRQDGTTGQAFENPERGFLIGVQPDGMAGLCVVDERGNELDRLGSLPDELQCVRTNEVIYGTVRGPFRTRGEPIAKAPSALQALDRRANRSDQSPNEGLPPQARSTRL